MVKEFLALLLIPVVCSCIPAQSSMQRGERFSISIYGSDFVPKLKQASLISTDKSVMVFGANGGNIYGRSHRVGIPEDVEFVWQVEEQRPQLAKIKVRPQIPAKVLEQLAADPRNSMEVQFYVRNGNPGFRWDLRHISDEGRGTSLVRGGDWSR